MAWRRPPTSWSAGPSVPRLMLARTSSCIAWWSLLAPRFLTCRTAVTFARLAASRPMAATSAVVTVPLLRAMTTSAGVSFGPWNGVASRAASMLGLLAGRRLLLFCWATLVSDGKNKLAATAAATPAATTAQRKRTDNRAVASKTLGMRNLPGGSGANETDLYSPYRQLLRHARYARRAGVPPASAELPIGCLVNRRPWRSRITTCHG